MTEQGSRPFLRAIKRHNWLVAGVMMAVLAAGVVISHWIVFAILIAEIKASRCHCSNMNIEASGNRTIINSSSDSTEKLAREILQSKGKIQNARSDLSRPMRPESNKAGGS